MFSKEDYEKAMDIHQKSIVIDTLSHGPHPFVISNKMVEEIERLIASGLSGWGVRLKSYDIKRSLLLSDKAFRDKYVSYWKKSGVTVISDTVSSADTNSHTFESALGGVAGTTVLCDKLENIFIKVTKYYH